MKQYLWKKKEKKAYLNKSRFGKEMKAAYIPQESFLKQELVLKHLLSLI